MANYNTWPAPKMALVTIVTSLSWLVQLGSFRHSSLKASLVHQNFRFQHYVLASFQHPLPPIWLFPTPLSVPGGPGLMTTGRGDASPPP